MRAAASDVSLRAFASRSSLLELESVDRSGLDQVEGRDFRFEFRSVGALHFEGSRHRTEGRREGTPRRVFEGLSGFEYGLFTDDAGAVDLFDVSGAIDDRPSPVQDLGPRVTLVRYPDGVEKEPATRRGAAVLGRIACEDEDSYTVRHGLGARFEEFGIAHGRDSSSWWPPADRMLGR